MSPIDHKTVDNSGCCIGQAAMSEDGLGLPKRFRHADATALTGFQSATVRSHAGMPWVGTNVLETNTKGRKKMKPTAAAASGFFTNMPAQAPTQVMANAISKHKANARRAFPTPLWIRQPTAKPALRISTGCDRGQQVPVGLAGVEQ
jgi:hypothetical protein